MICVECGVKLTSETLYIEYSESNFKLIRCDNCSNVADKYVEYELLLVSIDLILLREQAYRHILFNRNLFNRSPSKIIPSLMVSVTLINLILKMVAIEHWAAEQVEEFSFFYPIYLLAVTFAEHLAFVGTVFLLLRQWQPCVMCPTQCATPSTTPVESTGSTNHSIVITKHFNRKVYLALTFPEMAKMITLLLQTWDSSPMLFFVTGGLCLVFQYNSFIVAMSYFQQQKASGCTAIFISAVLAKILTRLFFHSTAELLMLGIIT